MKRILAAALSLELLVSLAACGGKDRFDAGKVEEGVCYQLTGIAPDAVAMKVDGIDVPMDMYFYNLCYAASYMESYMNMYGMDLDWSMELQEGETVLDVTKDSILENTKSFAVIEKLAQENNVILDEAALSELEAERAETVESLGGEESYRAELAKLGLSEETYDRMCRSDYLYSALEELAATEGSSLYATDEQLIAYAAEQGYMTADHILLLTRDMSTLSGTGRRDQGGEEGAGRGAQGQAGRLHGRRSDRLLHRACRRVQRGLRPRGQPRGLHLRLRSDGRGV